MYLNTKSKSFCLLLIVCFFTKLNGHSQGCIDTIVSKQFNVENFGGTFWSGNYQDSYDNFYMIGNIRTLAPNTLKSSLVKFNNQKKIIWSKRYIGSLGFDDFAIFRQFMGIDTGQNLYYISRANFGIIGNLQSVNFLKLDSSGNILNNKLLKMINIPTSGYFYSTANVGTIFSTITNYFNSSTGRDAHFVAIDKDLTTIRWSKVYKPGLASFINASGNPGIEIDDTTSVVSTYLNYKNPANLNDTIYTFHLLKINSLTGDIIQQKAYSIFDQQNPGKTFFAFPYIRNINYANKQVTYQITRNTPTGSVYAFFTIDSNLNIINTANYLTNTGFNITNYNSVNNNDITANGNITQSGVTKFATINWNRNLQLVSQKTYYSNQFTGSSVYANITYENNNNTFSYFVANGSFLSQISSPIYLFDNTKNPNFEFDCSDKAAAIFQPVAPYIFIPDASSFISQPGYNYILTDNPNTYTAQNNIFSEQKYCDLVSICTSLKIQGKSSFCLNSGNVDSFKVVKNSTCLRKTTWTVNNSQMQILQSNDTSVKVKFLQPFIGYIKAAYENCSVIDSFYIEVDTVYNMKSGVYLGPDTIQCVGKSITLSAAIGFKKYEWQDGSTFNTFTTSDTGLFHIKVLDSCNTVFRDSIYISANPKNLNISFGTTLCEFDTAKITLPANLTNYTWQPLIGTMQIGNTLLLFPTSTTVYTINAQSHNNCFITDTVQIKKKDCYRSIYFPTAFSPNGDNKNDTYKPGATGILQSYSLIIYNRYGNIVFHTNDINIGWDGKYQNKVQAGGYTWICTYTFRSRVQQTESGSFILLR